MFLDFRPKKRITISNDSPKIKLFHLILSIASLVTLSLSNLFIIKITIDIITNIIA